MELQARKKKPFPKKPAPKTPSAYPPASRQEAEPPKAGGYQHMIAIRCDSLLYNTIQNMVTASHIAQDFMYASPADFIRAALQAYREGMALTEVEQKGEKVATTIRIDRATKDFYTSLPNRLRTKLLERAIRTFIKQHR